MQNFFTPPLLKLISTGFVFAACLSVNAAPKEKKTAKPVARYKLQIQPLSANTEVTLESVELQTKKDGTLQKKWTLKGKCDSSLTIQHISQTIECKDSAWTLETNSQSANSLLAIDIAESGAAAQKLKWILYWTKVEAPVAAVAAPAETEKPADSEKPAETAAAPEAKPVTEVSEAELFANTTTTQPKPTSITQAFLDDKPIAFVEMDSRRKDQIQLRNYSPALADADKVEFFVSSGPENYQVTTTLEKAQYETIPWELWGPKITAPGTYQYRTTIWKENRDYLGTLNDIEFGVRTFETWDLNTFSLGFFIGIQPATNGNVFSLEPHWQPRYRLDEKWSLRAQLGLPILKLSGSGIFPAIEAAVGPSYRFGSFELQADVGMQHWFASTSATGLLLSVGTQIDLPSRAFLLRSRALQVRYSYLGVNPSVHLFRVAGVWNLF